MAQNENVKIKHSYSIILIEPFSNFHICLLLIRHPYHRHNHLLQANAAMLKSVAVIISEMIIIIGVAQIQVAFGKDERRVYIRHRQTRFARIAEGQYFLGFVI